MSAPSAALADHGEPFMDADLESYFEIAQAHWDAPAPSCAGPGGERIPLHVVLYDNPDPDIVATAEQPGCRMWLDRDFWPAPPSRIACTIIAHEWGHLLGHGHSPDEDDLMYAEPFSGAPGCSLYDPRVTLGTGVAQSSGRSRRRRPRAGRVRRAGPEHRTRHRGKRARKGRRAGRSAAARR
ncbi:MAG TPA: hypothetical protein VHG69_06435 [Thermoleophilaceae bacterium]|nr:hypothetical protein [Thermoleophilaceae bacterium]